jgi:hypothetical protein
MFFKLKLHVTFVPCKKNSRIESKILTPTNSVKVWKWTELLTHWLGVGCIEQIYNHVGLQRYPIIANCFEKKSTYLHGEELIVIKTFTVLEGSGHLLVSGYLSDSPWNWFWGHSLNTTCYRSF